MKPSSRITEGHLEKVVLARDLVATADEHEVVGHLGPDLLGAVSKPVSKTWTVKR